MIDSQPDLAHVIRRVRGGYLKIQGTWMPYEVSKKRRTTHNPLLTRNFSRLRSSYPAGRVTGFLADIS